MRKTFTVCLALLFAALMPLSALASETITSQTAPVQTGHETITTVTFQIAPGLIPNAGELPNQLAKELAIRLHKQGGMAGLELVVSGKSAAQVAFVVKDDMLFVHTPLIHQQPLGVSVEDVRELFDNTLIPALEKQNPETAAVFKQSYGSLLDAVANKSLSVDFSSLKGITEEQLLAMLPSDDIRAWYKNIIDRIEYNDAPEASAEHDAAARSFVVRLDKNDLIAFVNTPYYQEIFASIARSAGMETDEQVQGVLAEVNKVFADENAVFDYVITGAEDAQKSLVHLDMDANVAVQGMSMVIKGGYNKLTVGSIPTGAANLVMDIEAPTYAKDAEGKPTMTVQKSRAIDAKVNWLFPVEGSPLSFQADINIAGMMDAGAFLSSLPLETGKAGMFGGYLKRGAQVYELLFPFVVAQSETGKTVDVSAHLKQGAEVTRTLTETDIAIAALHIETEIVAPTGFFSALEAATPDTALRFAKFTEEEMTKFSQQVTMNAQMGLLGILSALPQELSQQLFGTPSAPEGEPDVSDDGAPDEAPADETPTDETPADEEPEPEYEPEPEDDEDETPAA